MSAIQPSFPLSQKPAPRIIRPAAGIIDLRWSRQIAGGHRGEKFLVVAVKSSTSHRYLTNSRHRSEQHAQ